MSADDLIPFEKPGDGPLTVVPLHATGGDEMQLVALASELAPDAHLLAPRGTEMEDGHTRRFFRRRGMTDLDIDDLRARADELAGALASRIESAGRADRSTIALGYSNGANIALGMMFRHPGLFAGAALLRPMLPYRPDEVPDLSGTRVLVAAGLTDPFSPAHMTRDLVEFLERGGADVTLALEGAGHEITPADLHTTREWFDALTA